MSQKSNIATTVDALGAFTAQAVALKLKIDELKGSLREAGVGTYEGELYSATVYDGLKETLDADAATEKLLSLGVPRQWITAHTSRSPYTAVKSDLKRSVVVGKAA